MTIPDDPHATIGTPDSEYSILSPGFRFDTFELHELLGRGGMGEIWKARDLEADRDVAIKFVPRELQRLEEEMDRVRETFRKIHALQDRHICPHYLLKNHPLLGTYLVMKYIDGVTLRKYRKRFDTFPPERVADVLKPIAAALDSAHGQGVIHRDIKPSNILVGTAPENPEEIIDVQLIDFGLAAEIRQSMTRVSQKEVNVSGTRPYMAPEQWRGQKQNAATDQYALAVVAYELMAGHLPFEADDTAILRQCVLHEEPVAIDGVPETVNLALKRGLAKEREKRFASCSELIRAITGDTGEEKNKARKEKEENKQKQEDHQEKKGGPDQIFSKIMGNFRKIADKMDHSLMSWRVYRRIRRHKHFEIIIGAIVGALFGLCFFRPAAGASMTLIILIGGGVGFVLGKMYRVSSGDSNENDKNKNNDNDKDQNNKDENNQNKKDEKVILAEIVPQQQPKIVIHVDSRKMHWGNAILAVPCMIFGALFGLVSCGAIGAGVGLLFGLPQVFAPSGAGLGILIGALYGWKFAANIRFR